MSNMRKSHEYLPYKIQTSNPSFLKKSFLHSFDEIQTANLNPNFEISCEKSFFAKYQLIYNPTWQSAPIKSNPIKKLYDLHYEYKAAQALVTIKDIQSVIKNEALKKLHGAIDNLQKECKEEGCKLFFEKAKQNAKQILNAVYSEFPDYDYDIYPTEDQEIAIDCNPIKGRGLLILCDSKGGIAYFSTFDTKNSRFRCDDIKDFPYDLLSKEFKKFDAKIKPLALTESHSHSMSFKKFNAKIKASLQSETSQQNSLGV